MDDVGLLDQDEIAAELGLGDGDALGGFGAAFDDDLAPASRRSARAGATPASPRSSPTSTCPTRAASRTREPVAAAWARAPTR